MFSLEEKLGLSPSGGKTAQKNKSNFVKLCADRYLDPLTGEIFSGHEDLTKISSPVNDATERFLKKNSST